MYIQNSASYLSVIPAYCDGEREGYVKRGAEWDERTHTLGAVKVSGINGSMESSGGGGAVLYVCTSHSRYLDD